MKNPTRNAAVLFSVSRRRLLYLGLMLVGSLLLPELTAAESMRTPKVGDVAPNFVLQTLADQAVELKSLMAKQPVVLVVLRGWPGYQCPLCTKQVQDFVAHAARFREKGVQILMVYPGPEDQLKRRAEEFVGNKQWPEEFLFVMDPSYVLTERYGLRWDAKKETAYPSTFIIDRQGRVTFAHVSASHGDRVSADRVLAELK